jgi:transporter family protein
MKDWVFPAILSMLAWGIWGFIPKLTTKYISPVSAVIYEVLGGIIVGVFLLFFVGFRPEVQIKGICLALLTGIVGFLGALCYLMAVRQGKVSVIVTMTALYPIISIGLAYGILHESLSIKEGIGIVLALVAIGLFTF